MIEKDVKKNVISEWDAKDIELVTDDEKENITHYVSSYDKLKEKLKTPCDFEEWNRYMKLIGDIGEKYVYEREVRKLIAVNREDLAECVNADIAKDHNNGYDILSYTETGEELHIEVLEATMRKLFKQDTELDVVSSSSEDKGTNPLLIERIQSNDTVKRNIVPHYSFKSWGKNIPQEQLLIVYGKVYIELKEISKKDKNGEEIQQTYIHFKDIHTKELRTSCLKPQTLDIVNGNYYAVILGECRKNESRGYTYYNLWINFPIDESILLKEY